MSSKLDIRDILSEHYSTLRDAGKNKVSFADIIAFFALPGVCAVLCFWLFRAGLSDDAVSILIGALSILAGLLINVLVLLYTVKAIGSSDEEVENQERYIKEVNANILYGIMTGIFIIIALCISLVLPTVADRLASAVIVGLLAHFTLTLVMTLKRLKILVGLRFQKP